MMCLKEHSTVVGDTAMLEINDSKNARSVDIDKSLADSLHGALLADSSERGNSTARDKFRLPVGDENYLCMADFRIDTYIGGRQQVTDLDRTTGEVIADLSNKANIKELDFTDSDITDEDLAKLTDLKALRSVVLSDTAVGDKGLENLAKVAPKEVKELTLDKTNVTDKGLAHLSKFEGLQYLTLKDTSISDEGLKEIGKLKSLKVLDLRETGITDEGLKIIAQMPNLTDILLGHTKVTDKGLEHLHSCRKLRQVNLENLNVSDEAVEKLRKTLVPFVGAQIFR
jgi:Leucine-rich repeat (LRR) protein